MYVFLLIFREEGRREREASSVSHLPHTPCWGSGPNPSMCPDRESNRHCLFPGWTLSHWVTPSWAVWRVLNAQSLGQPQCLNKRILLLIALYGMKGEKGLMSSLCSTFLLISMLWQRLSPFRACQGYNTTSWWKDVSRVLLITVSEDYGIRVATSNDFQVPNGCFLISSWAVFFWPWNTWLFSSFSS